MLEFLKKKELEEIQDLKIRINIALQDIELIEEDIELMNLNYNLLEEDYNSLKDRIIEEVEKCWPTITKNELKQLITNL